MDRWNLEFDNKLNVGEGPVVPRDMKSLLIYGSYPPAHPFNLCLSQLARDSDLDSDGSKRPLVITAQSRSNTIESLTQTELAKVGGSGRMASLLAKICIYYPETAHHWMLLLSSLRMRSPAEASDIRENPFRLDSSVSMVVLHEPSAYCFSDQRNNVANETVTTTDQYLRLITAGLAFTHSLSQCNEQTVTPPLVVFDSRISQLKLPILPTTRLTPHNEARSILPIAKRYFDWVCEIDAEHGGN